MGLAASAVGPAVVPDEPFGIRCILEIKAHKEQGGGIAFSPDGERIATTGDKKLIVWEVATGKKLREKSWEFAGWMEVFYSQDGKEFVTCRGGEEIQVLEAESLLERKKFTGPAGSALKLLCASWDRRWLLIVENKKIIVLESNSLKTKWSRQDRKDDPYVNAATYSPSGKLLAIAVGDYDEVRLCEAGSGKEVRRLSNAKAEYRGTICSLVFAPKEQFVAGVSSHYGGIRRWKPRTGKELPTLSWLPPAKGPLAPGRVRAESEPGALSLAQSPDGRTMAVACRDGRIRLLEAASGRVRCELPCSAIKVTFSRDGRFLAALGFPEGDLRVWDLRHHKVKDATKLSEKRLENLWRDLAADDAVIGFRAVVSLAGRSEQAVGLLSRLRPVPTVTKEGLAKLVALLDDDSCDVRQTATHRLDELGAVAESALRLALRSSTSLEMDARLKRLVQERHTLSGRMLRNARAVEVLERIGSPEAKAILEKCAKGCKGALLTEDAQDSLGRLRGSYRSPP